MKLSKDFLKGILVGGVAAVILSSAAVYAADKYYKTKSGASFPVANFAVGNEVIPQENMPDKVPPMMIDGRTFIPLRASVDAVGGDVDWDDATKTASVKLANNVIMFRNGEPTDFIQQGESGIKFLACVPIQMLQTFTDYESTWVFLHESGKIYGGESTNKHAVTNRGIYSYYSSSSYNFTDKGVHTIMFKIRKAGTEKWTVVAKRKIKIE